MRMDIYILSRADDMIIKSGMNIYPKEIENQIITINKIQECVVYGIKAETGQTIAADLVLKDDKKPMTKKDIILWFYYRKYYQHIKYHPK